MLSQVFFGSIEGDVRRERWCQFVTIDFLIVAVDVDVEPVLGYVVGGLAAAFDIADSLVAPLTASPFAFHSATHHAPLLVRCCDNRRRPERDLNPI